MSSNLSCTLEREGYFSDTPPYNRIRGSAGYIQWTPKKNEKRVAMTLPHDLRPFGHRPRRLGQDQAAIETELPIGFSQACVGEIKFPTSLFVQQCEISSWLS